MNDTDSIYRIERWTIKEKNHKNGLDTKFQTKSVNLSTEHKLFYCSRVYFDIKPSSGYACVNEMKQKKNTQNPKAA